MLLLKCKLFYSFFTFSLHFYYTTFAAFCLYFGLGELLRRNYLSTDLPNTDDNTRLIFSVGIVKRIHSVTKNKKPIQTNELFTGGATRI